MQYRVHGQNDSNLLSNYARFGREVARAQARWKFARETAGKSGIALCEQNLFKSLHLLQLRVASLRLTPASHPLADDSRTRAMRDAWQALWSFPATSIKRRLLLGTWAMLTLVVPRPLAVRLISLRFAQR